MLLHSFLIIRSYNVCIINIENITMADDEDDDDAAVALALAVADDAV